MAEALTRLCVSALAGRDSTGCLVKTWLVLVCLAITP